MDAGVKVLTEAAVNPKGIGTMFFEDPDGNVLHLLTDLLRYKPYLSCLAQIRFTR